jgi:hypothetical protein
MENSDWRMENVRMEIYSLLRHHSEEQIVRQTHRHLSLAPGLCIYHTFGGYNFHAALD